MNNRAVLVNSPNQPMDGEHLTQPAHRLYRYLFLRAARTATALEKRRFPGCNSSERDVISLDLDQVFADFSR